MSAIKIPLVLQKSFSELPSNDWSFIEGIRFLDLTKKSFQALAQKIVYLESNQSEVVLKSIIFNIASKNGPIDHLTAQKIADLAQIILGKNLKDFCKNDGSISIRPASAHVNTKSRFYEVYFENNEELNKFSETLILALGENYSIHVKTGEY
ncbi:MAG: hypothetical protein JXA94_04290 [Parachlamydiales bacterium]|nr:hypothetical protein [Parachlamydiales bacterium]